MIRVAINGFGRIGRAFFKHANMRRDEIDIVAINDLADIENLAYLLKYDSATGPSGMDVSGRTGDNPALIVDGKEIKYLSDKDPGNLPWSELGVDIVVESTGFFAGYEKSRPHIEAGAKKVVITGPVKDEPQEDIPGATVLMGINNHYLETCKITSNASCTTNASSPLVVILNEAIGIKKALLNTTHGYTSTQSLVDSPIAKDWRRGRAAAQNIIPSSTGAAIAVTQAVPEIKHFDGISLRVPVITGSIADITFLAKRDTSVEEVNDLLRNAAKEERWRDIFTVTEDPIVSSDIIGNHHAAIADLAMTRVVGGNLVKVLSWYDNENGYAYALTKHVIEAGKHL